MSGVRVRVRVCNVTANLLRTARSEEKGSQKLDSLDACAGCVFVVTVGCTVGAAVIEAICVTITVLEYDMQQQRPYNRYIKFSGVRN